MDTSPQVRLFALGKLALRRGEPQASLEYAVQGQQLEGSPLELGRCRRLEGWALKNLGRLEEARKCAEIEVARAEALQNLEDLAAALLLSDAILSTAGEHLRRREILLRAIAAYDELGNPVDAAAVRNNLADVYRLQGQFEAALLELHRAIGDVEHLENEALPYLLDTLGDVQFWQHQPHQAAISYRRAITAAQRQGLRTGVSRTQLKLVGAMLRMNEHQQARSLLEVIEIPESLEDLRSFVAGWVLFDSQPDTALALLSRAAGTTDTELAVRATMLHAELTRRVGTLEQRRAQQLVSALEKHGFDTVLSVDLDFTAPTLEQFVNAGWLPAPWRASIAHLGRSGTAPGRPRLEIRTLGVRLVTINNEPVRIHLTKSFEVLSFLARHGPSSREAMLEALWASNSPQSQRYFKVAIRRLRTDLCVHPAMAVDPVPFDQRYAISRDIDVTLDLNQLESAVHQPPEDMLEPILVGIQGEFLPDSSSAWIDDQRTLSLEYALVGNIKLGNFWLEREPTRAVEAFRRALTLDPFNGECLLQLVAALMALNESTEAKRTVERFRAHLKRELNVDLEGSTRQTLAGLGL
ncbi:MAG: hypothetical protein HC933_08940 [Pleurocapsa sp. SU_196_0]|nr:hypothetical protein [Pleurocapsa sp. SU_196_0]